MADDPAELREEADELDAAAEECEDRAEALAAEYARRGERVLTVPDVSVPFEHYGLTPADVREYNAAVLRSKCEDCAAGLERVGVEG